ncbi:MAG: hypothetical protein HY291_08235 [Planctomycetes bacterium]|nr:hypothetical protein [Planctomycetota bacterium]
MLRKQAACFAAILAALNFFPAVLAQAADDAKISVQAAKASDPGKKLEELPASLKPYEKLLKQLGFTKYKDTGKDSGAAAEGKALTLKAGGYTVDVTVVKHGDGQATIKYVVKDGGKAVGENTVTLKSGDPNLLQVGDAASPTVLILQLN